MTRESEADEWSAQLYMAEDEPTNRYELLSNAQIIVLH